MSTILDIGQTLPPSPALRGVPSPSSALGHALVVDRTGVDSLELSPVGRVLSDAASESSLRLARIRAVREDIRNGTYETPDRLDGTVRRLLDVLA